jgi:hypothetical protein
VRLADAEHRARELPHREKHLLIVVDFLRGLLDLHLRLVQEVERKLAPKAVGESRSTSPLVCRHAFPCIEPSKQAGEPALA